MLAVWLAGATLGAGAFAETIVLISHPELELDGLTVPILRQLYLGRRSRYEGRRIHWYQLPPGTPAHRGFARLALERSERDLERYWLEQALSGGPLPPRELASPQELVERIAAREGAVGYLTWDDLRALPQQGLRIVPLWAGGAPRRPGDAAYPLRDPGLAPPPADP